MKKDIRLLIIFFQLYHLNTLAQPPSIEWSSCYGGSLFEYAYWIQQTGDGGFVVSGTSDSNDSDVTGNHNQGDCWLVKTDSSGNIQWARCYGGNGGEIAQCVSQTRDGGYIFCGWTFSIDGDVTGGHGGTTDCWVVKLDSFGNIEWNKCYGGSGEEKAYCIQQSEDSGYVIMAWGGSTDGDETSNNGAHDYWLIKTDGVGTIQWQKSYGGSSDDEPRYASQTYNHGYIMAGYTYSNDSDVSGNHGGGDCWIVKTDSIGNIEWQKCFGGTTIDKCYSLVQTKDSGYAFVGYPTHSNGNVTCSQPWDYWLVKLDAAGNILWQKCFGGSGDEEAFCIRQTSDDGFIITGSSNSNDGDVTGHHGATSKADYWVVKTDSTGTLEWEKSLGGSQSDWPTSIEETRDGGYVIAGYAYSNDGDVSGNNSAGLTICDYWIVKLAPPVGASIESLQMETITAYPDPAHNNITITFPGSDQSFIVITNVVGQVLYSTTAFSSPLVADCKSFEPGLYIITIQTQDKRLTRKFLKE